MEIVDNLRDIFYAGIYGGTFRRIFERLFIDTSPLGQRLFIHSNQFEGSSVDRRSDGIPSIHSIQLKTEKLLRCLRKFYAVYYDNNALREEFTPHSPTRLAISTNNNEVIPSQIVQS